MEVFLIRRQRLEREHRLLFLDAPEQQLSNPLEPEHREQQLQKIEDNLRKNGAKNVTDEHVRQIDERLRDTSKDLSGYLITELGLTDADLGNFLASCVASGSFPQKTEFVLLGAANNPRKPLQETKSPMLLTDSPDGVTETVTKELQNNKQETIRSVEIAKKAIHSPTIKPRAAWDAIQKALGAAIAEMIALMKSQTTYAFLFNSEGQEKIVRRLQEVQNIIYYAKFSDAVQSVKRNLKEGREQTDSLFSTLGRVGGSVMRTITGHKKSENVETSLPGNLSETDRAFFLQTREKFDRASAKEFQDLLSKSGIKNLTEAQRREAWTTYVLHGDHLRADQAQAERKSLEVTSIQALSFIPGTPEYESRREERVEAFLEKVKAEGWEETKQYGWVPRKSVIRDSTLNPPLPASERPEQVNEEFVQLTAKPLVDGEEVVIRNTEQLAQVVRSFESRLRETHPDISIRPLQPLQGSIMRWEIRGDRPVPLSEDAVEKARLQYAETVIQNSKPKDMSSNPTYALIGPKNALDRGQIDVDIANNQLQQYVDADGNPKKGYERIVESINKRKDSAQQKIKVARSEIAAIENRLGTPDSVQKIIELKTEYKTLQEIVESFNEPYKKGVTRKVRYSTFANKRKFTLENGNFSFALGAGTESGSDYEEFQITSRDVDAIKHRMKEIASYDLAEALNHSDFNKEEMIAQYGAYAEPVSTEEHNIRLGQIVTDINPLSPMHGEFVLGYEGKLRGGAVRAYVGRSRNIHNLHVISDVKNATPQLAKRLQEAEKLAQFREQRKAYATRMKERTALIEHALATDLILKGDVPQEVWGRGGAPPQPQVENGKILWSDMRGEEQRKVALLWFSDAQRIPLEPKARKQFFTELAAVAKPAEEQYRHLVKMEKQDLAALEGKMQNKTELNNDEELRLAELRAKYPQAGPATDLARTVDQTVQSNLQQQQNSQLRERDLRSRFTLGSALQFLGANRVGRYKESVSGSDVWYRTVDGQSDVTTVLRQLQNAHIPIDALRFGGNLVEPDADIPFEDPNTLERTQETGFVIPIGKGAREVGYILISGEGSQRAIELYTTKGNAFFEKDIAQVQEEFARNPYKNVTQEMRSKGAQSLVATGLEDVISAAKALYENDQSSLLPSLYDLDDPETLL